MTQASKLGEPLGQVLHVCPARQNYLKSLLTQIYQSRWPHPFFCVFQLASTSSLLKKTLGQYPAIMTSFLVHNANTAPEVSFEWSHHRIPLVHAHKLLSHLTIRHYLC